MKNSHAAAVLICSLCLLSGCVDLNYKSVWKDHEIVMDGKDSEWNQQMQKERNIGFAACNDSDNLYLCLSVTDKMTKAQMLGLFKQDFYIWFAGQDRKKRGFGLRFRNDSLFMDEGLLAKARHMQVQAFQVIADEMMHNLRAEVVHDYFSVEPLSEVKEISAGFGVAENGRQLIYEIKMPLEKSLEHPFAIGAKPGEVMYICLETTPVDTDMIRKQVGIEDFYSMQNDLETANRYGRSASGRIAGFYSRKAMETETALENFNPVQVWCKVILANQP